jgi:hypothetical protein
LKIFLVCSFGTHKSLNEKPKPASHGVRGRRGTIEEVAPLSKGSH